MSSSDRKKSSKFAKSSKSAWAAQYIENSKLVIARLTKVAAELVDRLMSEVPRDSRQILGERLTTYLDYSAKLIAVRKDGKHLRVTAASIVDNLDDYTGGGSEILSESDINDCIEPLAIFPDMVWIGRSLATLRNEGESLNLDRKSMDAILREEIDRKLHPSKIKKSGKQIPLMESDPKVASRRTELRNILRSRRHVTDREICKRWSSLKIGVPDSWDREGIRDWDTALKQRPNNVHKLISLDRTIVQTRLHKSNH